MSCRRSASVGCLNGLRVAAGFTEVSVEPRLAIALSRRLRCPKEHAKFFEVTFRQITQNLGVDVILAK